MTTSFEVVVFLMGKFYNNVMVEHENVVVYFFIHGYRSLLSERTKKCLVCYI